MNKVEGKLKKWQNRVLNMVGRKMVINHFIIHMVIYCLSCWQPREEDLNYFTILCRNFLWGGNPWIRKMAKVKWDFCCGTSAVHPKLREALESLISKKWQTGWQLNGLLE